MTGSKRNGVSRLRLVRMYQLNKYVTLSTRSHEDLEYIRDLSPEDGKIYTAVCDRMAKLGRASITGEDLLQRSAGRRFPLWPGTAQHRLTPLRHSCTLRWRVLRQCKLVLCDAGCGLPNASRTTSHGKQAVRVLVHHCRFQLPDAGHRAWAVFGPQ